MPAQTPMKELTEIISTAFFIHRNTSVKVNFKLFDFYKINDYLKIEVEVYMENWCGNLSMTAE